MSNAVQYWGGITMYARVLQYTVGRYYLCPCVHPSVCGFGSSVVVREKLMRRLEILPVCLFTGHPWCCNFHTGLQNNMLHAGCQNIDSRISWNRSSFFFPLPKKSFQYGRASEDSWQCDLLPLLGPTRSQRVRAKPWPPSSPLPRFRGNCRRQVRILLGLTWWPPGTWPLPNRKNTHSQTEKLYTNTCTRSATYFTWVTSWSWVIVLIQRV